MLKINKNIMKEFSLGLQKFKPIVRTAIRKDFGESDTVTIITDILSSVFGYEKYEDITSEYAIRNTYCDLAVKVSGKIKFLIECKAVGIDLKEPHIRQAMDYGVTAGIEWIILTNSIDWQLYKIHFRTKPVHLELVFSFDFLSLKPSAEDDMDMLYAISKRGFQMIGTSALSELYENKAFINKYVLGQLLLNDSVVQYLRRFLRKISPDVKVDNEKISKILANDVIKREIFEEENFTRVNRMIGRKLKNANKKSQSNKIKEEVFNEE
ncbi:MAG: type I restriction enzyme HsdR N-terminal domain-containing protein [Clostridiales Family XIII bacterium]|jgi:hypothetical protein|nr:type I restriction enzyme HsdR N-terminal domain-containing protein [Clostridiales Family XIII bacterium]